MVRLNKLERRITEVEKNENENEKKEKELALRKEAFQAVLATFLPRDLTNREIELIKMVRDEPIRFRSASVFLPPEKDILNNGIIEE